MSYRRSSRRLVQCRTVGPLDRRSARRRRRRSGGAGVSIAAGPVHGLGPQARSMACPWRGRAGIHAHAQTRPRASGVPGLGLAAPCGHGGCLHPATRARLALDRLEAPPVPGPAAAVSLGPQGQSMRPHQPRLGWSMRPQHAARVAPGPATGRLSRPALAGPGPRGYSGDGLHMDRKPGMGLQPSLRLPPWATKQTSASLY